jgi:hypothetical protein
MWKGRIVIIVCLWQLLIFRHELRVQCYNSLCRMRQPLSIGLRIKKCALAWN